MRGSAASTVRRSAACARGGGAKRPSPSSRSPTPKLRQRGAEEDRRQMALAERLEVERLAGLVHQLELVLDRRRRRDWHCGAASAAISICCAAPVLAPSPSSSRTPPLAQVVGADEIAAAADRPGHRRGVERQRLLDLVEQIERVAALAVHLVDEGDDRDVAQPADLEQLAGPRLDALGGVDHHDRGVDRGQRAIGVLARSPRGPACRAG